MLRVGVIGLGVGEQHVQALIKHPHAQVTALCDLDAQKLKSVGERYGVSYLANEAEQILTDSNIDVVSIASYDNYHAQQIILALQNNKHVFVEKPLCLFEAEAREIKAELNKRPQLRLSSNLILRKSPRFIDLKNRIKADELGRVFYVEGDYNYGRIHKITEGWRGTIPFYSVMYGGGVHIVDLLQWLIEDEIVEVSAFGNKIATENTAFRYNDTVVSILQFKNGVIGKIAANFGCVYPHFHKLSLYGTSATFENAWPDALLYQSREYNNPPLKLATPYPGVAKGDLIEDFIRSIMDPSIQETVTIQDIFKTMSVCFAMEKAVKANGKIEVEQIQ